MITKYGPSEALCGAIPGVRCEEQRPAGDLITDASLLQQALRNAPDGWQKMNIQSVLQVRVISGGPTASVVATQFW